MKTVKNKDIIINDYALIDKELVTESRNTNIADILHVFSINNEVKVEAECNSNLFPQNMSSILKNVQETLKAVSSANEFLVENYI